MTERKNFHWWTIRASVDCSILWNTYVLLCFFFPALANHSLCFSSSQKPRNNVVFAIPPSCQRIQNHTHTQSHTHIHTCMQADTAIYMIVHILHVSVWHVAQNTVHVATSQHPGKKEISSDLAAFKFRGEERREKQREKGRGTEGEMEASPFLFFPHSSLSLPHPSFPSPLSFLPPPTYPPLSTPPPPLPFLQLGATVLPPWGTFLLSLLFPQIVNQDWHPLV